MIFFEVRQQCIHTCINKCLEMQTNLWSQEADHWWLLDGCGVSARAGGGLIKGHREAFGVLGLFTVLL